MNGPLWSIEDPEDGFGAQVKEALDDLDRAFRGALPKQLGKDWRTRAAPAVGKLFLTGYTLGLTNSIPAPSAQVPTPAPSPLLGNRRRSTLDSPNSPD